MIKSMTGCGQFEIRNDEGSIRVDVQVTNGKGLNTRIQAPEELRGCEVDIENTIRRYVTRGSVNVTVEIESFGPEAEYHFNSPVIKAYYEALSAIKKELGCGPSDADIPAILALPGCLTRHRDAWSISAETRKQVLSALEKALAALVAMREKEGESIAKDLISRTETIERLLDRIESGATDMVTAYGRRLKERVTRLLEGANVTISDADLARELALFAEKTDVSEEISRLRSHSGQLRSIIESDGAAGRKLEFVTQEMFRDANTMSSKIGEPSLLQSVFELKNEVDRIREQVFNVE